MNKQAKILELSTEIQGLERKIDLKKIELAKLEGKTELTIADLLQDYTGHGQGFLKFTLKPDKFEYILGGDGRSQPWSETRKGKVLHINCNIEDLYVSSENLQKLVHYIKAVDEREIDAFFINGRQWP